MDIASERITASYEEGKYFRDKNDHPETRKSSNIFRLYWNGQLDKHLSKSQKLENIKLIYIKDI